MDKNIILDELSKQDKSIVEKVYKAKQEHVFQYWCELKIQEKQELLNDLKQIDFDLLKTFQKQLKTTQSKRSHNFKPAPITQIPKTNQEKQEQLKAKEKGEQILRKGNVACFLVAGGQGSRLDYAGPKGCFPITTVEKKSLFQVFAEKIKALQNTYNITIPWYIMTSKSTHEDTKKFFEVHDNFNLTDIHFEKQAMFPTLSKKGNLILKNKSKMLMHPNGHGGAFQIMQNNLKTLQKKNIKYLFYWQVDNVLANICDPIFLGHHINNKSEMSAKAVERRDSSENVGLIGIVNNKPGILEYSELSQKDKIKKDDGGNFLYNTANIAIHIFSLSFIEKLQKNKKNQQLPFHKALKKTKLNNQQQEVIKFETFIFDALQFVSKTTTMMVKREEEFAPLKNKKGKDTLQTVHFAQNKLFASWAQATKIELPKKENGEIDCNLEISSLFALNKEEFVKKIQRKKNTIRLKPKKNYYIDSKGNISL